MRPSAVALEEVTSAPESQETSSHPSDASRAAAGTVALGVLQTTGRVLALLFVVAATRMVAPSEFGRYSIVAGLVAFAGFVADFGSTTVITRKVSQAPASSDALLAETLLASIGVGLLAFGVVVAYLAVGPYPSTLVALGAIGGLAIPADAALTSMVAALDGHGFMARRALVSFVRLAIVTGGGSLAVVISRSITPAVVMIALGPIVGCAMAAFFTRRYQVWSLLLRPRWRSSIELFRAALPFAILGGIGAIVARLDLLILSLLASTAEVARYDLPLRATEAATSLGLVVGTPALFILSRRLGSGDIDGARRAYRQAARVAYLVGIPLSAVFIGLCLPLTRLTFGARYLDSAALLGILGASVWLTILSAVQGAVVVAGGVGWRVIRMFLGVLAAAAVLDVALIPVIGAYGAALSTVLVSIVSCFVFDRLNHKRLGMHTPRPSVRLVVAATVSSAVMLGLTQMSHGWLGLLALPLLPALLLALRVVTPADARDLLRLVRQGRRPS